jgi:hypothetical protein
MSIKFPPKQIFRSAHFQGANQPDTCSHTYHTPIKSIHNFQKSVRDFIQNYFKSLKSENSEGTSTLLGGESHILRINLFSFSSWQSSKSSKKESTSSPCETSLHMPMCIGFFDCFVESKSLVYIFHLKILLSFRNRLRFTNRICTRTTPCYCTFWLVQIKSKYIQITYSIYVFPYISLV